jgi:hypothetical protein
MADPARNSSHRGMVRSEPRILLQICKAMLWSMLLLLWLTPLFAQVSPVEIKDPRLKATEQAYLPQLLELNRAISQMKFPYKFSLNRQVGLDPKDQVGADTRGLEFVNFHEREVLKFTGNYNAAFNADRLTPNQRANRVLDEVILPMLRLLPEYFKEDAAFDAFGFEIGYHVRRRTSNYEYEGKESLVVVFDKSDGLRYAALSDDTRRQEILNRSEIYQSGNPIGLALNADTPFDIETLVRRPAAKETSTENRGALQASTSNEETLSPPQPGVQAPMKGIPAKAAEDVPPPPPLAGNADLDALQKKYQSALESLRKEGIAKYHFVEYAPLSFVNFRDKPALQATLRDPETFDKDSTSIYKRAARTFDVFLAPQLKGILEKVPESPDFNALDFTVILNLTSSRPPQSSEAIEFVLPLKSARRFAAAGMTSQDLINESVVLVNGVRIGLNLAQVE